jgi:hypothetical protein
MGVGGLAAFGGSAFGAAGLGSLYGVGEGLPFWSGAAVLVAMAALCAALLPVRAPYAGVAEPLPVLPMREGEPV